MYKKFLSVFLCLLLCISFSAPRAAATGVTGAALTVAEMAGVVSLIAGSLGIVFTGAGDMHDACEAFVKGLDPNSPAYLALASAVAQGSTIYIAGANAVNYLGGLVDDVQSFFMPGDNVVVQGNGVSFTNLGQIYVGDGIPPANSGVATFDLIEAPVEFQDSNGNSFAVIRVANAHLYETYRDFKYYQLVVNGDNNSSPFSYTSGGYSAQESLPQPYVFFSVVNNRLRVNLAVYLSANLSYVVAAHYDTPISWSLVSSVSGGGGEEAIDIPVFQEAGALAPDLVGGVWDKLAEDAAAQNGNVTIDTNVGTYQGGATGYVDGDPNGVIAAPQAPSLGGAGSTKTETDTSTGTTTQTQTQTGTQAVPNSTTANPAITKTQAKTQFNGVALTLADIFPFCIPFDIYAMLTSLAASRETPTFDVRLYYPGWLDYTYTFEFSDWDNVAAVLRAAELGAFVIGLAAATRKFIKW